MAKNKMIKYLIISVLKGIIDCIPFISSISSNLESNHKIDDSGRKCGKGKIDYVRLITNGLIIVSILVLMIIYLKHNHGIINKKDVKTISKTFKKINYE